jgi:hypothetical protein
MNWFVMLTYIVWLTFCLQDLWLLPSKNLFVDSGVIRNQIHLHDLLNKIKKNN